MAFSYDSTGIEIDTLQERIAAFNARLQDPSDGFGEDFRIEPSEAIPMCFAILAEEIVRVQGALKAVLDARRPGAARGVHADDVASLTNTTRLAATKSTIAMQYNGTANETIPTARTFRHTATQTLWDSTEAVLLNGSGVGTTTVVAQEDGPINVSATTGWEIVVGDANLTSVQSTAASAAGRFADTDEQLEARRKDEAGGIGKSTVEAIKAELTEELIPLGASSIRVYHNNTGEVDSEGVPGHAVHVVVDDSGSIADLTVAEKIFAAVPVGIQTHGAVTSSATDSQGNSHTVKFTRVTSTNVWIRVTVDTTGAEVAIPDQTSLTSVLKKAVADYGRLLPPGRDVVPARYASEAFCAIPQGQAIAVTAEYSTDDVSYFGTVLEIDSEESAEFDEVRVSVVYTP